MDRREKLARSTLELIAIPSPSEHEAALAEHVVGRLAPTLGPPRWRDGVEMIFGGRTAPGRPVIALVAHLDTVPLVAGLEPRIGDGYVHGRGASDLKGGLAIILALIEALPPGRGAADLMVIVYGCEEIALARNGLKRILAAHPDLATRCDLAICVEPTDNVVELGCLGTLHAAVTVAGHAAHSARPWQGVNAIHRAAALIERVARRAERRYHEGELEWREVMSVTTVAGGRARNVIPAVCTFNVNYRFAPDKPADVAVGEVHDLFADGATVEIIDLAPSARPPAGNAWVERLIAITGRPARAKQAWTDVAQLAAAGIAACNFGPGEPAMAHQDDERVPIDNLERAYSTLAALLGA